jgi:hypothetical protein
MVGLAKFFDRRDVLVDVLVIVKPKTFRRAA